MEKSLLKGDNLKVPALITAPVKPLIDEIGRPAFRGLHGKDENVNLSA